MIVCRSEAVARLLARERGESYGLSVHPHGDGGDAWIVGAPDYLRKLGVPSPIAPRQGDDAKIDPRIPPEDRADGGTVGRGRTLRAATCDRGED